MKTPGSIANEILTNLPRSEPTAGDGVVILDASLAEYAGHPAWEDTAWIQAHAGETPEQAIARFERARAAERQEEQQRRRDWFLDGLPKRYVSYKRENLRVHAGNKTAVETAEALQPGENLFIHGPAGNGKTHLAVATGFRMLTLGQSVRFYGVVDLFNQIRASFSKQHPEEHRPNLLAPDVLILDDLGKVKPTEFVFQEFYAALEARWANEKTTIFTANHRASVAAAQLSVDAEGAGAILSRMASGHVVAVAGKDERLGVRK